MTAVTIQSNKIVSNEVKDNYVPLEPSYGEKPNELFGQPNTFFFILFSIHGLSQDIEYSSLCYTVGPCCLSILYIPVCIC